METTVDGSQKESAVTSAARSAAASKRLKDKLFTLLASTSALAILMIVIVIGVRLLAESSLARATFGAKFLTGTLWDVPHERYGALPYFFGSLVSSMIAIFVAVPISVGAAILLNEILHDRIARPIRYFMELLAAIPSVVYGMWGFLVLCPWLLKVVDPWLAQNFGSLPSFEGPAMLTNMLAAGVILAIMISPFIISIVTEVFRSLPDGLREASLALGANKWETIRNVVLPSSSNGILVAVMLALGRALGETMAVVWVIGNTPQIKASILQSGYSMPVLLANQFGEAFTDPLQRSSLMEIALILFVTTMLINGLARALARFASKRLHATGTGSKIEALWNIAASGVGLLLTGVLAGALGYGLVRQMITDMGTVGIAFITRPAAIVCFIVAGFALFRLANFSTKGWDLLRKIRQTVSLSLCTLCGGIACAVLALILGYIAFRGSAGISWNLFTQLPRPPGVEGGGLKNAIVGTALLVGIATLVGVPLGILGGIFLSEFKTTRLTNAVRFSADILGGVPSMVIGLFAYSALVLPFHGFSAFAGSLALAIIMVPIVMRITEEILRLVPLSTREASLGLGASRAETIMKVVVPAARSGLLTGVMLAVARVSGETAPLIFTAFGSDLMNWDPRRPTMSLTLSIYKYAGASYDDWVSLAWSAALILVCLVLVVNVLARVSATRIGRRLGTST